MRSTRWFAWLGVMMICAATTAAPLNLTASRPAAARSPALSTYQNSDPPHAWVAWLEYDVDNGTSSVWARYLPAGDPEASFSELQVASPGGSPGEHRAVLSPAVVTEPDGNAWVFWIEVNIDAPSGGTLMARHVLHCCVAPPDPCATPPADSCLDGAPRTIASRAAYPAATLGWNDQPWVFWEAGRDASSSLVAQIHCSHWDGSGFTVPELVSAPGKPAYEPAAVLSTDGTLLWVVWKGPDSHPPPDPGQYNFNDEVFVRRRGESGPWSDPVRVTSPCSMVDTWAPCSEPGNTYLGHHVAPTVARGGEGNAWIGWVAEHLMPGIYTQTTSRRLQLRLAVPSGGLGTIRDVPTPVDQDVERTPSSPRLVALSGRLGVYYRCSDVADLGPEIDAGHPPFSRGFGWNLMEQWGKTAPAEWLEPVKLFYQEIPQEHPFYEQGYDEPPAIAQLDSSPLIVLVAWQADDHEAAVYAAPHAHLDSDIWVERREVPAVTPVATLDPAVRPAPMMYFSPREKLTPWNENYGNYSLFLGNLHLHTNLSACSWAAEDPARETYRRLHDLVDLDFVALTDHDRHTHNVDWARQQALCALHHDDYGATPGEAHGTAVLLGYEFTLEAHKNHWTCDVDGEQYGHMNVVYAGCSGPLLSHKVSDYDSIPKLWDKLQLEGAEALTIPHHSADQGHPVDLNAFDQDVSGFARLFEIYQARGSFEWRDSCSKHDCANDVFCPGFDRSCEASVGTWTQCCKWPGMNQFEDPQCHCLCSRAPGSPPESKAFIGYYRHALAMGHRMGVVASPDHGGFWGLTGVFAESQNQGDLFEALQDRRTFALSSATARMALELYGDGHIMGEEYDLPLDRCPRFSGRVVLDYPTFDDGSTVVLADLRIYRVVEAEAGHYPDTPTERIFIQPVLDPFGQAYTFTAEDEECPGSGAAAYYLRAELVPHREPDPGGVNDAMRFLYPDPTLTEDDAWRNHTLGWTSPVWVTWTCTGSGEAALGGTKRP